MRRFLMCAAVAVVSACSGNSKGSSSTSAASSSGTSGSSASSGSSGTTGSTGGQPNQPGNIIIADQWNNRVIEVNPTTNAVVWSFGDNQVSDAGDPIAGTTSVISPNDAERLPDGSTLISGSGAPPASAGGEPACTNPNGCVDNRVLRVDLNGNILWQYGQVGVTGAGPNQLSVPVSAVMLSSGHVLITDQGNQRIIEVQPDAGDQIVWQYGVTGAAGADAGLLNNPNSAERLANGDTLIADESNNRVIEVDGQGNLVWSYGSPSDTTTINGAGFASRLPNGDTLIADVGNSRAFEVTTGGTVVWSFDTSKRPGSVPPPTQVSHAVRMVNGNTLICDQANSQIIEVTDGGAVSYTYGQEGVGGNGAGQINWPYSATIVGDFTGLTPPN